MKPAKEAKKKAPKPEKKKVEAAAPVVEMTEEHSVWSQCDLRVGRIVECEPHPESAKLFVEKIDLGEGRLRTIASGLQEFVPLEDMTKGLCIVFANLKPRKLADLMSEGMVLCAGNEEHTQV
jgi:methionine--tRNA ligase beta chain